MDAFFFFALFLACLVIVAFLALIALFAMAMVSGMPVIRGDAANPLNAGKQYSEFLLAINALRKRLKLKEVNVPSSLAELVASCVGRKGVVLLEGKQLKVSARLAGNELMTELETPGAFPLTIDVVTKSSLHLPGLGMDFMYIGGKEIALGRLAVRPEFERDAARTRAALKPRVVEKLEEVVLLKPKTMNLSSQLGDFYNKKLAVYKDHAYVRDYGLPRDSKYLVSLATKFLKFTSAWQKAK